MNTQVNLYFDMDGVPAVYGFCDSLTQMEAPGYFRSRPAQANVVALIRELAASPRYHVHILSAVFDDDHSVAEKKAWLQAQGLADIPATFVPCGSNKGDYVLTEGINILVDDYSKNLFAWEQTGPNFFGIKFRNGNNGNHGTWREHGGYCLDCTSSAEEMYLAISVICILLEAA